VQHSNHSSVHMETTYRVRLFNKEELWTKCRISHYSSHHRIINHYLITTFQRKGTVTQSAIRVKILKVTLE
jgi:hypothetical protein